MFRKGCGIAKGGLSSEDEYTFSGSPFSGREKTATGERGDSGAQRKKGGDDLGEILPFEWRRRNYRTIKMSTRRRKKEGGRRGHGEERGLRGSRKRKDAAPQA